MKGTKRQMEINNANQEFQPEMIKNFIKDDLQKMYSTLWMIINDEGLLDEMAKRFIKTMNSTETKNAQEAINASLNAQKSQPKQI